MVLQAERSDLSSRPNLYKVLYAFEAYRNNWRKAAAYMYRYFVRLNREGNTSVGRQLCHELQERLRALSASINALQLVDPMFAWLDSVCEADDQISPSKRPRNLLMENCMFCLTFDDYSLVTMQQCFLSEYNAAMYLTFILSMQPLLAQTLSFQDYNFVLTLKFLRRNTH